MSQTTYRSRLSPYQPKSQHPIELMRAKVYDVQDKENPIRAEIEKCLGTHTIKAVIEEDRQTLNIMGVDGLVSFLCTLTKDGRVLSQGRGSALIGPTNRFFQRSVACAFNSSIADAAIRASKVLDLVRDKTEGEEAYEDTLSEPATMKQLEYLQQLIQTKVTDTDERRRWEAQLRELTKDAASEAIARLKKTEKLSRSTNGGAFGRRRFCCVVIHTIPDRNLSPASAQTMLVPSRNRPRNQ